MRYLRKMDRYVAAYFMSSYLICFIFFLGLFIVIDLVGRVDEIIEAAPLVREREESLFWHTVELYLLKTPEIFLLVAPYLTVMSAMFSLGRLRKNNELIPMIMAGVSIFRILLPIFVLASVFLGAMVIMQEYLAPWCAEKRMLKESLLIRQEEQLIKEEKQVFRDGTGKEIVITNYDVGAHRIGNVFLSFVKQEEGREIHCSIKGKNARWLGPDEEVWELEEGLFIRQSLSGVDDGSESVPVKRFETDLTPADILMRYKGPSDMTFREIRRAYSMNPEDRSMKILFHYHITFPLSNLILLLLGIPFVLRHESRSHYLGLVIALLICGGYFVLDLIMNDLGAKNYVNPIVAAWFATIFCSAVGIYLFDSIKT